VGIQDSTLESHAPLRPSQIADLRLAASKMTGATRRAFQAEMACTKRPAGGLEEGIVWVLLHSRLSEIGLRTPGVNPGVKARSRRLQVFVRRF
jgi:hypothetical protein